MTVSPVFFPALIAIGGLLLQAVMGWAYLQVLRSEVAILREKSAEHGEKLADHDARLRVLESKNA